MQYPQGKNVLRKGFVIKTVSSVDLQNARRSENNCDLKDELTFFDNDGNAHKFPLTETWYWIEISNASGTDYYNTPDTEDGRTMRASLRAFANSTKGATMKEYKISREGFEIV